MSQLEFWGIYLAGLLVLLVPLAFSFWVMEKLAKRLGRDIIKFIRGAWEE